MEERLKFVLDDSKQEESFAELCRRYGVSRKTGYKWVGRFAGEGLNGLTERSRAAVHHPNEVLAEVAEEVLKLRREHPKWGPLKLRARLQREAPEIAWPAASTIGEMVKRAGLSIPRKKRWKATPSQSPLAHANAANQVWSTDFKGWFPCGDGSRCDPFTLSDGFSRFVLRCQAVESTDGEVVRGIMEAAFDEYGLPEAMRSDNGPPFATAGLGGLSALSVWWIKLGIRPERIRPGKPQQNGRHERMHRTLKQDTAQPPAANLRLQQQRFDEFREEYNWVRPHEALEMRTPAELYEPSPRPYPSRLPEPEYPDAWEVRGVGSCGLMRWWKTRIFVGRALSGEAIAMEPIADGEYRVWFYQHPIGILDERRRTIRKLDDSAGEALSESSANA